MKWIVLLFFAVSSPMLLEEESEMRGMGGEGEDCPFEFNFDPATFKVGDTVSYKVNTMEGWPFVGTLLEVHEDYVVISPGPTEPDARYRGTRESRPMVDGSEVS